VTMDGRLTPLYEEHRLLNGKLVDYAGWILPVQYSGITAEHLAVRQSAGLFDVSHMGQITVTGQAALAYLNYLLPRNLQAAWPGRVYYSPMCQADGGTVDDLLLYPLADDLFLLVVNAANTEKDFRHLLQAAHDWSIRSGQTVSISDDSQRWAQLALQGPAAASILREIFPWAAELGAYHFSPSPDNKPLIISRTGYTGEDGFEISLPPEQAPVLWKQLIALGAVPAGLGARDSLRLEAGMPLYGHELAADITPLEAGLGRFIDLAKSESGFVGQAALCSHSPARRLIGLTAQGRAIPRAGYPVYQAGQPIGVITSGTFSPSLNIGIGMALVEIGRELPDAPYSVLIREREEPFTICGLPFVRRTVT